MVPGTVAFYGAVICGLVQIYFFSRYFSRLAEIQNPQKETDQPPVSVIICARNEATNLSRYLPLILDQDYPAFEVLVVDHASTDNSRSIVQQLMQSDTRLRYLYCTDKRSSKKPALKMGLENSGYVHILVTDADCWPQSRHWITRMMAPFHLGAEIVLGVAPLSGGKGLLGSFSSIDAALIYLQYASASLWGNSYMGVGRNMAYLRHLYRQHDHSRYPWYLGGDDDLFVSEFASSRFAMVNHRDSLVWTRAPESWRKYYLSKRRHVAVSWSYSFMQKMTLMFFAASHWGYFAAMTCALILGFTPALIFLLFIVRSWFFSRTLLRFARPFLNNRSLATALTSEIFFLVHYPVVALFLLLKPPVKW
jgi:poly-beta-1,6-N-acetyl-D-glucosamine synthase